jgi:hypothetical protein
MDAVKSSVHVDAEKMPSRLYMDRKDEYTSSEA